MYLQSLGHETELQHSAPGLLLQPDQPRLSPAGAPRVPHQEVPVAVTDAQHVVVQLVLSVALRAVEDPALVEPPLVGVHAHRHRLTCTRLLQGRHALLNPRAALDLVLSSLLLLALPVASLVRVHLFSGQAHLRGVPHAVHVQTSVAAFVVVLAFSAVDQLLFTQIWDNSGLESNEAFDGANSREGPAGATLALVFDGADESLVSQIDLSGDAVALEGVAGQVLGEGVRVPEVGLCELFEGEIGELVDSELEVGLGLVGVLDGVEVVLEDGESVGVLGGGVLLAVLELEVLELLERGGLAGRVGGEEQDGGEGQECQGDEFVEHLQ